MRGGTSLTGKVAVLLGGSGGIGAASAFALAQAGARIAVVGGRDLARAETVASSLPGNGHRAYAVDIANTCELNALSACVADELGRADILINGAGFTRAVPHGDLDALDDELIDKLMICNVRAPIAAVRAFRTLLAADRNGLVVNISSIAATTAVGSNIAYCAAKSAMDTMGAALARALAPDIRVISVAPGAVDTDFVPGRDQAASERIAASTPLRRLASPEDVADVVLACATHLRFTTGSVVQVDGGRHL